MRYGLILVALLAAVCLADDTGSCSATLTFNDSSVYTFDFSALSHKDGEDDTLTANDDNMNSYFFNLCGQTSTGKDDNCKGASVCQESLAGDYNNAGTTSTQKFYPDNSMIGKGVFISYTDGTKCSNGDPRQTNISLTCDPNVENPLIDLVQEASHCSYTVHITTKWACGKSAGGGAGETAALVILLIIICGLVLYFVIGAIYQKKVKDAANLREMIIHNEFWCALPLLIKDGILFICHGFKKGDYISV